MISSDRILTSLVLLLLLLLTLSCNPNPQPEGLTPIPTLAPGATLTPATEVEGPPATEGTAAPSPAPEGGDPAAGATIFASNCVGCHGQDAQGSAIAPSLVRPELAAKDDDHYRQVIANGVAGSAMPAWGDRLSAQDIEDVIAFLRSLQ